MDVAAQNRRVMEAHLGSALKTGEIDVAYQPQFEDSVMVGVEALARWTHPSRGVVSPAFFIPLAEEFGLINVLGEYVLRRVFNDSYR